MTSPLHQRLLNLRVELWLTKLICELLILSSAYKVSSKYFCLLCSWTNIVDALWGKKASKQSHLLMSRLTSSRATVNSSKQSKALWKRHFHCPNTQGTDLSHFQELLGHLAGTAKHGRIAGFSSCLFRLQVHHNRASSLKLIQYIAECFPEFGKVFSGYTFCINSSRLRNSCIFISQA